MSWISEVGAPGVRQVQLKITEHVCKCTFTRRLLRMMRSLATWNISLSSVWTEAMMTEHLDWRFIPPGGCGWSASLEGRSGAAVLRWWKKQTFRES